ncbi:hypothetical protein NRIC_20600 [Enterococcus florum]|uniref:AraC effector-binding domain-containing protein n=1 Tax=Enterococcus florum TaxID=2480627 RepID=A0A4V0WPK4_9ENTE|nr:GyrI-like domain-containing protein [Enterococcus florum]GCF94169.1 hypothetical protein NRIC_20600 [Enterococcus florum]
MEYRIEELDSFTLVGFKKTSTNKKRQGMKDCPAFWNEILSAGKQEQLLPMINHAPFGLISASFYNIDPADSRIFDYYIAVSTTNEAPEGLETVEVPALVWAVFPCTRDTLGKTQIAAVTKWAPKSKDYELLNKGYITGKMTSGGPDIEVYGQGDDVEIWVPVKRK